MSVKNRKSKANQQKEIFSDNENNNKQFNSELENTTSTSSVELDEDDLISLNNSIIHSYPHDKIEYHQSLAAKYIENCKNMHVAIDPSIVIALRTGWTVLQPTRRFTEGSMLPLMDILETDDTIKKVNFAHVSMQDSR